MIWQIRNHLVYYLVPLGPRPHIVRGCSLRPNLQTVIRAGQSMDFSSPETCICVRRQA